MSFGRQGNATGNSCSLFFIYCPVVSDRNHLIFSTAKYAEVFLILIALMIAMTWMTENPHQHIVLTKHLLSKKRLKINFPFLLALHSGKVIKVRGVMRKLLLML